MAGDFIESHLEIFLVNLDNLAEKTILKTGWFGSIKYNKEYFTAEILSVGNKTNNLIGKCYSTSCRAEFGDLACRINKIKHIKQGKVTSLAEINSFIDISRIEHDDHFTKGIVTFTSGYNKDRQYNISEFRDTQISLDSILELKINIGDQYNIIAGCDKSIHSCRVKFNNVINFRGEPYIPSRHKLVTS